MKVKLADIIKEIEVLQSTGKYQIYSFQDITFDSRKVAPGVLFVAVREHNPMAMIIFQHAIESGAPKPLFASRCLQKSCPDVTCIMLVKDSAKALGHAGISLL